MRTIVRSIGVVVFVVSCGGNSASPDVDARSGGDASVDGAPPRCGDDLCSAGVLGEDCVTCPSDCGACPMGCPSDSCITLDSQTPYQSARGWEVVAFLDDAQPGYSIFTPLVLDRVAEMGINRVRLEVRSGVEHTLDNYQLYRTGAITYDQWRCRRYATVDDNGDPDTIDPAGFHFTELDERIEDLVLPLRQRLAGQGEQLFVLLTYVSFTAQIGGCGSFLHDDQPDDYAELILAVYQHMDQSYGFVPDAVEAVLEPDNNTEWTAAELGSAAAATGARLENAGYDPSLVLPGTTCMSNAPTWIDQMSQVPGALDHLSEVSYHRYCGASVDALHAVRAAAAQHGVFPSMLEWWSAGNDHRVLREDLVEGNATAWEIATLGEVNATSDSLAACRIDNSDPTSPVVTLTDKAKLLRQYFKFVRAGAVRIGAASSQVGLRPTAWVNADDSWVVVVEASGAATFDVANLPAGTYGITYTTAGEYDVPLADVTIASGDQIEATIPAAGLVTLHGK